MFKDKKGMHNEGKIQQNKLIQKYIERPLLIQIYNNGVIEHRKFDIRQWVLVTCFYPLQIYYFDTCYLKICGSEFKLDDIKDRYRHLSNYSLQKTNTKVANVYEDLIMGIEEFENHIRKWQDPTYNWKEKTLSRMKQIIIETLKSGSELIVSKPQCFEMYGFDIVLDYKYQPWLIEVNLSPACSERTKWLSDVLSIHFTR